MAGQQPAEPMVEHAMPLLSVASFRLVAGTARRVCAPVEVLAGRLFRDRDAEARAWGMQVIKTRWGGRIYRDPRIAQLAAFRREHPARAAVGDWPEEWNL